jgi:hypothetical protein
MEMDFKDNFLKENRTEKELTNGSKDRFTKVSLIEG